MAVLCASLLATVAGAATLTASLDRDTITLGESATLSLAFDGGAPGQAPAVPNIPGLRLVGPGTSQQISFNNGVMARSITYSFEVTPVQAGDFTIPSIAAVVDGTRLTTRPLKLTVLKPGAPTPEAINSGSQPAFLKLALPKQQLYLGEPAIAEVDLYVRDGVIPSRPQLGPISAEGFNVGQQFRPGAQRNVRIGPAVYHCLPFLFTLKPVKTGLLKFGPVTFNEVVELPSPAGRRDPFYERFGLRSPFSEGEQKQMVLATESTNVQCLPWPSQNVPPGFKGAVGNYAMSVTAGPTNLMAGDPITVRVRIEGRGALDGLALPDPPGGWRDFKVFPPTAKPVETSDPFGLQGAREFEQIVVPQGAEVKELPAFSFSFFDPEAQSYRTLTHPAVPLVVRPGGSVAAPTIVASARAGQDAPSAQDIVHIKPRLGLVAQAGPPLIGRPWFVLLQAVPVLGWVWALAWRRRADRLANNPRLRRRRQVAQVIRDGLVELRRLAAQNQAEPFFATLFRLLQEQLGERLDLPASAITEAVIEEHLRPRGAPEQVSAAVHELFQSCNLARYAPVRSSQQLTAMVAKLEAALRQLQALEL